MFNHYGVPKYIAGMGVSAIAYKTDKWNIARLENSFKLSGVMMIDATAFNDTNIKKMLVYGEVAVYLGSVKEVIGRHKRQMHEIRRYTKAILRRS